MMMPTTLRQDMTLTEARKFCRKGLAALGMRLPTPYRRGDNFRPNRIDLIAASLLLIQRDPECEAAKQAYDQLATNFHCDLAERKAAAARLGYLWDDQAQGPIINFDFARAQELLRWDWLRRSEMQ